MTNLLSIAPRVRPEILESFRALADLGRQIGGPHAAAARIIDGALGWSAQWRLAKRDAQILELRARYVDEPSENRASKAIAHRLSVYASSSWKRGERSLSTPPQIALGTERELFWRIMHDGDGKPPGASRVRQILAAARVANETPVAIGNERAHSSLIETNKTSRAVNDTASVIKIMKASPQYAAAEAHAHETLVAGRRAHLAEIARLDAEATKAYPAQENRKADALAKEQAAVVAWKEAQASLNRAHLSVTAERLAFERARAEHEHALISAEALEFKLLATARDEFEAEIVETNRALVSSESVQHNPVTRAFRRVHVGNGASVAARANAIRASLRDLPSLKMIEDPRGIPAALAKMRASWPAVAPARSLDEKGAAA